MSQDEYVGCMVFGADGKPWATVESVECNRLKLHNGRIAKLENDGVSWVAIPLNECYVEKIFSRIIDMHKSLEGYHADYIAAARKSNAAERAAMESGAEFHYEITAKRYEIYLKVHAVMMMQWAVPSRVEDFHN